MENPQRKMQALQRAKHSWTADERDEWIQTLLAAAELLKPGAPVLNDLALELQMELYSRFLDEVGKDRFELAYRLVLNTSKFRPDISELREAAGAPLANPYHVEALADLKQLIVVMREFGKKVKPIRCEDGTVKSPERLPESIVETCRELGFGDAYAGFEFVWNHPSCDLARGLNETAELPFRSAEKIEQKFVQTWVKVNAK